MSPVLPLVARGQPAVPKPKRETMALLGVKLDRLVAHQADLAELFRLLCTRHGG